MLRAGGDRLDHVAGKADAAIGNNGNARGLGGVGGVHDGGELRDAHAGDDAGRADAARTDADFERVHAGLDQVFGGVAVAMLPAISCDMREMLLDPWMRSSTLALWP